VTALLTILSVLAAWALLGVLLVGLLLVVKSLQSIRHWFEKSTVQLRAVEHQTRDLGPRAAVLTASLRETVDALRAASAAAPDAPDGEETRWTT
jgi:uncharacterized protein YoxC